MLGVICELFNSQIFGWSIIVGLTILYSLICGAAVWFFKTYTFEEVRVESLVHYFLLKDDFHGVFPVKGKEDMSMYFQEKELGQSK